MTGRMVVTLAMVVVLCVTAGIAQDDFGGGDDAGGRGGGGGGLRGAARRSPESLESPDGRRSKEQGIGHNGNGGGEILTSTIKTS